MEPQTPKMHPMNLFIYGAAILTLIIGISYLTIYFIHLKNYEETSDAQIEAFINPISARTGGFIKEVRFTEHQHVKKGDTLIILDNREPNTKLSEAEAAVEDANAQLIVLQASIAAARTATLVNQDQIIGAKSRLWEQQQNIKRYENLLKEEAATGQEFEQVKSKFEVASSDYQAAKNNLKASISRIMEMESRRAILLANLKYKKAELEFARINLMYTIVTAPGNGTMGRRSIMEGQQVQSGQTLASIVQQKEIWITANFKETQVSGMHLGQKVEIVIDAIDDQIYEGKIEAIAASTGSKFSLLPVDNSTGNFVKIVQRIPVKVSFKNPNVSLFKAGMNVKVMVRKTQS